MIRQFHPRDMNNLIALAREHAREMQVCDELPFDDAYYTETMRQLLIDEQTLCLVYESNSKLIGYAVMYLHTMVWNPTLMGQMNYFYIKEGERNKMLADSLWNACIKKCKESGAKFFLSSVCAFGKDYKGSTDAIHRASTYFEHKKGEHCGNSFVHRLEVNDE